MIKLEAQIAQNKKDQEKLSEEEERLRGELEKLDEPKLEHGDYGRNGNIGTWLHAGDGTWWSSGDGPSVHGPNTFAPNCLGNIFVDLERNREDLESFSKKVHGSGVLEMCVNRGVSRREYKVGGYSRLQFDIGGKTATASLVEATEIHQKLGQIIATIIKEQNNDRQRKSSSTN